ncbi:MAG: proline dehydrogenase family protein, partial [Candidatus Aenigmarchaeota archaeon]|nr:proline dehydrogenase family protein [Candidatus Aenigmarchaeota archaeon]
ILHFLGEHSGDVKDVIGTVKEYYWLIDDISKARLSAGLSVKLTELGLDIDQRYCLKNVERIAEKARAHHLFVWVDMEGSHYTDSTISVYLSAFRNHRNLGIALQSNLRRSGKDLARLLHNGGIVRLVKGAYRENDAIAFKSKAEIRGQYLMLMDTLFRKARYFAIATHDPELIAHAVQLSKRHRVKFEFQLLMGIMDRRKKALVKQGFRVAEYIPYGRKWAPYVWRRIREKRSNILLVLRSLFGV